MSQMLYMNVYDMSCYTTLCFISKPLTLSAQWSLYVTMFFLRALLFNTPTPLQPPFVSVWFYSKDFVLVVLRGSNFVPVPSGSQTSLEHPHIMLRSTFTLRISPCLMTPRSPGTSFPPKQGRSTSHLAAKASDVGHVCRLHHQRRGGSVPQMGVPQKWMVYNTTPQ